ncbi:hypothetical protein K8I61_08635 [bacterium]|nr:hypothetical protein [bacterium]
MPTTRSLTVAALTARKTRGGAGTRDRSLALAALIFAMAFAFAGCSCGGADEQDTASAGYNVPRGGAGDDDGIDDDDAADDDAADDDTLADDDADDDDAADDDDDDDAADDDSADDDSADDDADDDDTDPVLCVAPGGGARAPLKAGVAVGDFYSPIGISLAGYGARGGEKHPLQQVLGGSSGYLERPNVKAVALDNGQERVVFARLPTVFVSEVLHTAVTDQVCERTGIDLSERFLLSGTHTHSGPGHFYPLPAPFSIAGADLYDEPITQLMAASVADAVIAAMDDLAPAKIGAAVIEGWDPGNGFSRDRRCENGPPSYKEDFLFLSRIERANGEPLAALVNYAMHGTFVGGTILHNDAPGALERGLERTFDTYVPVIFLNGPAGDVSPTPPWGYGDFAQFDSYSRRIGPPLREVWDGLVTTDDIPLEMITERVEVNRDTIAYADDEFGHVSRFTGNWEPFDNGGFMCGEFLTDYEAQHGSISDCNNLETQLLEGYYGCLIPVFDFLEPLTWFMKSTQIGHVRLGSTVLSFMPGELGSFLSKKMREDMAPILAADATIEGHATFGYANGYQMYLLTEWDWLQGGYETSMSAWGPKYGDFLAGRSTALVGQLLTPTREDNATGAPDQQRHPWPPSIVPLDPEPGTSPGTIVTDVAASYARFDTVEFGFRGGYTTVDPHRVAVERWDGGAWIAATIATGEAITDATTDTFLHYTPVPDYNATKYPNEREHRYRFVWETLADTPAGTYRIRANGRSFDGAQYEPYEVISSGFEIESAGNLIAGALAATPDGNAVTIAAGLFWPPATGYRVRNAAVAANENAPVTGGEIVATVVFADESEQEVTLDFVSDGHFEGSFLADSYADATVEIRAGDATDADGNANANALAPIALD